MKKDTYTKVLLIGGLIFLTSLGRIITNHLAIWNFTAIGACALFGGVVLKDKKYAYLLPLAALFLSDLFLQLFTTIKGFYGWSMLFNYGAFMLTTFIGTRLKHASMGRIMVASVGTGLLYFLISNFGVWALQDMYPKTFVGLMHCYVSAMPFYQHDVFGSFFLNTILSNVFYTGLLFGAYALLQPIFNREEQVANAN
ncbi:hypothetical protein LX64_01799 [Chitinophaga skermanii]|uniref:Uncharacterized protein n=1 Tax=Chitinophaga skermanii TaxID=331697 RepID=A0A327QSJ9_9BACT|nr:DUF6580 family putative transport protein [Chitinophaga skermanii]RAJ06672.1 hypothetical protein LX64_01799 [Chitinophaga skermanii]